MTVRGDSSDGTPALFGIRDVMCGPLPEIASRFSVYLSAFLPHSALVVFTRECTGRPRKVAGDRDIVDRVTIGELEGVKTRAPRDNPVFVGDALFGGTERLVQAVLDVDTDTLLVLVPKNAPTEQNWHRHCVAAFGVVAASIQHQVMQASPAYLAESRAASSERARVITEMVDAHAANLASILATLRSKDLDDQRARQTARDTASMAMIALRAVEETDRELSEEAVTTAFARLRRELASLLVDDSIAVEYVEPPADGRPVPGEIARAARAVVRTVTLACIGKSDVTRVRIAWDCDGTNLLLELRDDGSEIIDESTLGQQLSGRVKTLRGSLVIESTPGWGSRVAVMIPLDPPASRPDETLVTTLNNRELEVLGHIALGKRNRVIAENLGISESTVKFHVASVLRKLKVTSRGQAGALALEAGIKAETTA